MTDQYGLEIEISGGGDAPWTFTRSDGLIIEFPGAYDGGHASSLAIESFNGHAPADYVPPPTPDPAGFMLAVFADPSIPITTRNVLVPWKTAIQDHLNNPSLIAMAWQDLVASLDISAENQATIHGYAAAFAIPGI